jgi:hypothetical protein
LFGTLAPEDKSSVLFEYRNLNRIHRPSDIEAEASEADEVDIFGRKIIT